VIRLAFCSHFDAKYNSAEITNITQNMIDVKNIETKEDIALEERIIIKIMVDVDFLNFEYSINSAMNNNNIPKVCVRIS
jgi:hypothetical protein